MVIESAGSALELTLRIVCGAIALGSAELLWLVRRGAFADSGVWSWTVTRSAYSPPVSAAVSIAGPPPRVSATLILRILLAAVAFIVPLGSLSATLAISGLLLIQLLLTLRAPWGDEGSDQMTTLVLGSALISSIFAADERIVQYCAMFIGAQVTLSYVASGIAKLSGEPWRSGVALPMIMNHHNYGSRFAAKYIRKDSGFAKLCCWGVMLFQASFLLYYVLPFPYAYIYIFMGAMFHGLIGWLMRLNLFFLVFLATYPCLIFTHEAIRNAVLG